MSIKFNDNRLPSGGITLKDISALAGVKDSSGTMIVYTDTDKGHQYQLKPGEESVFYMENPHIKVFGPTSATEVPISHIIEIQEKHVKKHLTPILFPDMSKAWQDALGKCQGIKPHFLPFTAPHEVVGYCRGHGITIVVGIKLKSQKFLAQHQAELRSHGLRFIVNDTETIAKCGNKNFFQKFMMENGFGEYVPRYYEQKDSIRYPCIVKPMYGSFGSGQKIVHSEQEFDDQPKELIASEYIVGNVEYASHIFYLDRHDYWDVTYKKTYTKPFFILGQENKEDLVSNPIDPGR